MSTHAAPADEQVSLTRRPWFVLAACGLLLATVMATLGALSTLERPGDRITIDQSTTQTQAMVLRHTLPGVPSWVRG